MFHIVAVAIQYMILSVEHFKISDNCNIKHLFYDVQRKIVNESIDYTILLMIDTLDRKSVV